jgi:hypothetical protein
MFITLDRTTKGIGPRGYKGNLPFLIREMGFGEDGDFENGVTWANENRAPNRRQATPEQISRADAAIYWPLQYLKKHPLERKCLLAWCYCLATQTTTSPFWKELGLTKAEFDRAKAKGSLIILRGLEQEAARKAA